MPLVISSPVTRVSILSTMSPENVRMGKRITEAREKRGWNKADLARRAGVAASYVTRIEQGAFGRPSIDQIKAIAIALGVNVTDLTDTVPANAGIIGQLEAMGLDPEEEAQLMAEIAADVATLPPGRARLDVLRALRTLIRPSSAHHS